MKNLGTKAFLQGRRNFSGSAHSPSFKNERLNKIIAQIGVAGGLLGTSYYAKQNVGILSDTAKQIFPPKPPINTQIIDGKQYTRHIDAPKKSGSQSSRLINTFGIDLSNGNNKSHFALIKGGKNSGKSYLADVVVGHNTDEAGKHAMQITNLRIRCHTKEQYHADLIASAKLLKCLSENELESDDDYLKLSREIANQCGLRGGVINLTFICVRSQFNQDGDVDLPLFDAFYPKYQSGLLQNSGLADRGQIMDNVNLVFTSGEQKVTDYLEKLNFQSFNTNSENPDDIRFLRDDFYAVVQNEKFKNLKTKLASVPTDLVDNLIKKLKGNNLLLEMATNYLNHPDSESFEEFVNNINQETQNRDISEVLLEKNLQLLKGATGEFLKAKKSKNDTGINDNEIVDNVLRCLYSQHKDPQDRISKEQSRLKFAEFLDKNLKEDADFKPYVDAYNFVLVEAEKLLLVRPNRDGKSWLVVKPDIMDKLIGKKEISTSINPLSVKQFVSDAIGLGA